MNHRGKEYLPVDAFVGIDLAFAKGKRLPVALCVWESGELRPRHAALAGTPGPPRGAGNVAALDPECVADFAEDVATYLRRLEEHFAVTIRRLAIDAPSAPRQEHLARRRAETALDAKGISCIPTPSSAQFAAIREKVLRHLQSGGDESHLPHANQLWMLAGFALFERLQREWECLEVFPQATAAVLGANLVHKSKPGGVAAQLKAAARHTGWLQASAEEALIGVAFGPAHDRLDAYLSAWVAALPPEQREPLGTAPNDVIWVPTLGAEPGAET